MILVSSCCFYQSAHFWKSVPRPRYNSDTKPHISADLTSKKIAPSGEFILSWKDEEGDDIVVSSNGELQAALEECPGAPNSTLKMNVSGQFLYGSTGPGFS
jgi:hypothetical protein